MNRRTLLRLLLASGAGAALDIERLLWVPGQMVAAPARLSSSDLLMRQALWELEKRICFARYVERQYDGGAAIGATITVRRPARYDLLIPVRARSAGRFAP